MIWPFASKLAKQKPLENPKLKAVLTAHEQEQSPQSHLRLLQELNLAQYLMAAIDDEVKFIHNPKTGRPTVDPDSTFKLLMSGSPNGEPLLTLFTDHEELDSWAKGKSSASWVATAQDAWTMASKLAAGVIVNPAGAGWVMGEESIQWLQKHPL
jgi:hypothetical protein